MNLGQIVARGSVAEVIGRVERNVLLRNTLRIRIPSDSVAKVRKILKAMANVKNVTPVGEMEGWLQVELMNPTNGGAANDAYQINNKILSAIIRANIPILSFEAAGGRLQDVFLHLTEEAIE
jgi:hypothetical protein